MAQLAGAKWGDQTNGTNGGVVTWSIAGGGLSGVRSAFALGDEPGRSDRTTDASTLFDFSVRQALQQAFNAWSDVANITFLRVADSGERLGQDFGADIRIAFGDIDGRSGTLGLAYTPGGHPLNGDVLFDVGDRALFGGRKALVSVAAHEIGHSIGLLHTEDARALMFARFTGITTPQTDDIVGARMIYGAARAEGPNTLTMSINQANLDVQQGLNGLEVFGNARSNVIKGGDGRERIAGGAGDDELRGRNGRDTLEGDDGDDMVYGGRQNDRLSGNRGEDTLRGEDGNDMLFGLDDDDRLSGGRGDDTVNGGDDDDMMFGDADDDRLDGGAGADTARGGAGDDRLFGGAGRDALNGDDGNDMLRGGADADRLFGGGGDDQLFGGAGPDTLTGGAGRDVFVFNSRKGVDVVADFEVGLDRIDLSAVAAVSSFGDLTIEATAKGLEIESSPGAKVRLLGVDPDELDAADFIF